MEKKEYVITFMGTGDNSTFLNINRLIKNEGFEILTSEYKVSQDSIAGYFLVPGNPNDNSKTIEDRLKKIIPQFENVKFIIQNAKLFEYVYSI
ncbi:hypothetical protein KAU33_16630 [Candidatus Dependentiae bacterium]|nr:hypothetical protein [Candidatus Dependentiae bacterium]